MSTEENQTTADQQDVAELLEALIGLEEAARAVQAGEMDRSSIQLDRNRARDAIAKFKGKLAPAKVLCAEAAPAAPSQDCTPDAIEALRAYEDAFDELFVQCASNPIKNAWGREVNISKLNIAHVGAHSLLSKIDRGLLELPCKLASNGRDQMSAAIHYPECWDTAAYPTLESALHEMAAWFKCTEEECSRKKVAADFEHQPGCALGHGLPDWPADLRSYEERKAYQRGVADERHRAGLCCRLNT